MSEYEPPQSRIEKILQWALGVDGVTYEEPQSRIEARLLDALGETATTETVQSRIEALLAAIAGESATTEAPQSRIEKILHYALGEDVTPESPQSRIEVLLLDVAERWRESLPSEYQRVEYIESVSGAYISIPYNLKGHTEMDLKFEYTGGRDDTIGIMGNTSAGTGSISNPKYIFTSSSSSNILGYYYCSSYRSFSPSFKLNEDGIARLETKIEDGKFMIYVNGTANMQSTLDAVDVTCEQDTTIFGSPGRITPQRVYWCRFHENGTAMVDLVPCYRISDGVIGMYDLIGETFLTNDGGGSFTKGADV